MGAETKAVSRGWGITAGLLLLAAAFAGLVQSREQTSPGRDPDRWYHYALSREVAEHGLPKRIPQIDDLDLGRRFVDKELLFHLFTAAGFRLGGISGVDLTAHLIAFAFLAVLFGMICSWLKPMPSLILVAATTMFTPYFSDRLVQIRPHLLAMLWVLLLAWAVHRRRPWLALGFGFLFSESYHAGYVPLAICLIGCAFRPMRKGALAGIVGITLGVVLNPYFPGNVSVGLMTLKIALFRSGMEKGMESGGELLALQPAQFFGWFGIFIAALTLVWIRSVLRPKGELFLLLLASLFWVAAFKNPRATEYAVPFTVLAAAPALKSAVQGPFRWVVAVMALTFVVPIYRNVKTAMAPTDYTYQALTLSILDGLAAIPKDAPLQKKVMNCDWGLGSFLLYARPDLKFVDLLDPGFLEASNKEIYDRLRDFKNGGGDALDVARNLFHADYVICLRPAVNERLSRDPRFKVLYMDPPRRFENTRYYSPFQVFKVI